MARKRSNPAAKNRKSGSLRQSKSAPRKAEINVLLDEAARHLHAGDRPKAEAVLSNVLVLDSNHPQALLMQGNILAQSGRAHLAVNLFKKGARADPANPAYFAQMGRALHMLGRLEEAVDAFRQAITVDEQVPELFLFLGNVHSQRGDYQAADAAYSQALILRPNFAQASNNLGAIHKEHGKLQEALEACTDAIKADPKLAMAHANLGSTLTELGDTNAAIEACKRAVQLAPRSEKGFAYLGVALRAGGFHYQAVTAFRDALKIEPRFIDAHMNLGNAFRDLQNSPDAFCCYQRVIELDPANAQAHASQVSLLFKSDENQKALQICDEYLSKHPYNCLLQAARNVARRILGQLDQGASRAELNTIIFEKHLSAPSRFDDMQAFNQALADHVLSHPSLTYSPASHATREGQHTGELLTETRGPMDKFEQMARQVMEEYRVSHAHFPYLTAPSSRLRANVWGIVLRTGGHQVAHIHPTAWVSGVYYPRVPDSINDQSDAGWIEFGRTGREFPGDFEPAIRTVKPKEGLMLLFPSYLYHRTIPLQNDKERISIAFDFTREA